MIVGEFDLIRQYFSGLQHLSSGVCLGVGDDAAVLDVPADQQLVVATDTLVSGVHFPQDLDAEHIAARALLVNLSDLAAMGADPLWFTLALTLPTADSGWLQAFSSGLSRVATACGCALVGGDTTRGPLTVTITVHGAVPKGQALTRSGAAPGDTVFVTGTPGLGAAGLAFLQGELDVGDETGRERLRQQFVNPHPRLEEGKRLRGLASAAIDISDGLLADLEHICTQSSVGAEVSLTALPCPAWLADQVSTEQFREWSLCGGDDYELCFTVARNKMADIEALIDSEVLPATPIGQIVSSNITSGIRCLDESRAEVSIHNHGYKHF